MSKLSVEVSHESCLFRPATELWRVVEGELAGMTEKVSFPFPLEEGRYHLLKNDIID